MSLTVGAESVYMAASLLDMLVSLPRYNLAPSNGGFFYEP
jgi:hypothetical protein